jgi:hypothetical protein
LHARVSLACDKFLVVGLGEPIGDEAPPEKIFVVGELVLLPESFDEGSKSFLRTN